MHPTLGTISLRDARSQVSPFSYRKMTEAELPKLADIDRSETVHVGFEFHDGDLVEMSVLWDIPNFFGQGDGDHTLTRQLDFCKRHLAAGAMMVGAFDDEALVGIGLLTPEVRPGLAQLAYLHVSAPHRREGIASSIAQRLLELARGLGAERVYVSATPSQSAVEFYKNVGFVPTAQPLPELYAQEPEDIHMVLQLGANA
jgi:predicted N-acetyltransferase YhbS